jgi:hypothetical protein
MVDIMGVPKRSAVWWRLVRFSLEVLLSDGSGAMVMVPRLGNHEPKTDVTHRLPWFFLWVNSWR